MFALYADLRFYALFWRFCFMLIAVHYSGAPVPCWSIFSSKLIVVLYSISGIFWFHCSVSFDAPVSRHVPVPYSYFISVFGHQFHVDAPVSCHIPLPCSCFMSVLGHQLHVDASVSCHVQFHVPFLGLCWYPSSCWCSSFILLLLFSAGGTVQHLGCFKDKISKYEFQTDLAGGEKLELFNTMTTDFCVNRYKC